MERGKKMLFSMVLNKYLALAFSSKERELKLQKFCRILLFSSRRRGWG